jgi:hypothetical protein
MAGTRAHFWPSLLLQMPRTNAVCREFPTISAGRGHKGLAGPSPASARLEQQRQVAAASGFEYPRPKEDACADHYRQPAANRNFHSAMAPERNLIGNPGHISVRKVRAFYMTKPLDRLRPVIHQTYC